MTVIAYQVATEDFARFAKWHSYKANAILNSLEIVFWAAVCFVTIQANIQRCSGTGCTLSWIMVALSGILTYVFLMKFEVRSEQWSNSSQHNRLLGRVHLYSRIPSIPCSRAKPAYTEQRQSRAFGREV
jgi:hypothetical protein